MDDTSSGSVGTRRHELGDKRNGLVLVNGVDVGTRARYWAWPESYRPAPTVDALHSEGEIDDEPEGYWAWVKDEPALEDKSTAPLKDLKEALSSTRKPDITHVRGPFLTYTARPCELGTDKYERSNYLRAVHDNTAASTLKPDFIRFRAYLRAAMSHIVGTLDAMEMHQAGDPNLEDTDGLKEAAYAADTDVTPGRDFPPSGLPHVAHACSSLMMAVTQAVNAGLLPTDPGRPWDEETK